MRNQKVKISGMALIMCLAIMSITVMAAPVRVAIVPVGKETRVDLASAKLLERITTWPNCEAVDRTSVANILRERALSAGSSEHYADQLRAALPADVFAFIEPGLISSNALRFRVSETRSGAVLCDIVTPVEVSASSLPPLETALTNALQKRVRLAATARYLAWLGVSTEETGGRLVGEATALSALVGPELLASPQLAVLDRAHLAALGDETHLSAIDQALRTSVLVVEASMRRAGTSGDADISLQVRRGTGGVLTGMVVRVSLTNLPSAVRAIGHRIQEAILGAAQETDIPRPSPEEEAAQLAARAAVLATWKEWTRAMELAESAYALDRSQSNRVQLASILAAGGPDDPRVLSRAAEILTEYYHVAATERKFIPAEYRHEFVQSNRTVRVVPYGWCKPGGYHGRDPSAATNSADRSAWEVLLEREEEMFRTRLRACTVLDLDVNSPNLPGSYWLTWQARINNIGSYYPDKPVTQAALLTEVADLCVSRLSTNECVCGEAVQTVVATVSASMIKSFTAKPAGVSAYIGYLRRIHSSSDPLLRLASCYGIVGMQELGFQSALGDLSQSGADLQVEMANILVNKMSVSSPYRKSIVGERAIFALCIRDEYRASSGWCYAEPIVLKAMWQVFTNTFSPSSPSEEVERHISAMGKCDGGPATFTRFLAALLDEGYIKEALLLAQAVRPGAATLAMCQYHDKLKRFWPYFLKTLMSSGYSTEARLLAQSLRPGPDSLETLTGMPKPAANESSELLPAPPQTNALVTPWADYVIEPMGCGFKRPFYTQMYGQHLSQYDAFMSPLVPLYLVPNGKMIDIVDLCPEGVRVVRVSQPDGQVIADKTVSVDYAKDDGNRFPHTYLRDAASDARHVFLATREGVLMIDVMTGDKTWINASRGLPGQDVQAVAVHGKRLYIALVKPSALLAYDLNTGVVDVLSSEISLQLRSAWDGKRFAIKNILSDPKKGCLWLSDAKGVWRYDPESKGLALMASNGWYYCRQNGIIFQQGPTLCLKNFRETDNNFSVRHFALYDIESEATGKLRDWARVFGITNELVCDGLTTTYLPDNSIGAAKYCGDIFSVGQRLTLTRDEFSYDYLGDERARPVGRIARVVATDTGVVMLNTRGKLFLVRRREHGETQIPTWRIGAFGDSFIQQCAEEVLAGGTLTEQQKATCKERMDDCLRPYGISKKDDRRSLLGGAAAEYYVNLFCMSVISPGLNGGEPYPYDLLWDKFYSLRIEAYAPLKELLTSVDDPLLHAAFILPALRNSNKQDAMTEYRRLAKKNSRWAKYVLDLASKSDYHFDIEFVATVAPKKAVDIKSAVDPFIFKCASKAIAGQSLTLQEQETCQNRFASCLSAYGMTKDCNVNALDDELAAVYYANAFCMAAVIPERHGGWPSHYSQSYRACYSIKVALWSSSDDPFLNALVVLPAICNHEPQYAVARFNRSAKLDPAWTKFLLSVQPSGSVKRMLQAGKVPDELMLKTVF